MPIALSETGPLAHWLHALRVSVPPIGLLHVGAGRNNPSAFSALNSLYGHASQVLALEADASRASQLQATHSALPQVQVRQAVIAGSGGRASLLRTSVSDESGLCPPEHLHAVWPRLKALRTEDVEAVALAECWSAFVSAESEPGSLADLAPNWLFIDCLPAAELLQSAPKLLASADVVVARAVQPAMAAGSGVAVPEHLCVAHLQSVLAKQGLHLLGTQEENHPALVLAVFARDQQQQLVQERTRFEQLRSESGKLAAQWEGKLQELASAKLDAVKLAGDRQTQIDDLVRAREEQAKLVQKVQAQLEELRQAKAITDKLLTERNGELDRVLQATAQAEKVLQEKLDRIEQLTKARDEQSQLATQRQQEIDRLTKAHREQVHLVGQRAQQIEQLTRARDEQAKLVSEREKQILELTKTHEQQAQLTTQRQQQIDHLTKARDEQSQLATQRQREIDRLTKAHGEQVHLVPLEKYVALNSAYRMAWRNYLGARSALQVDELRTTLLHGLDKESRELVDIQLDIINAVAPNSISKYLHVSKDPKYDLLPNRTRRSLRAVGCFDAQQAKLTELRRQLDLPEPPLKELLTHSGLLYIRRIAKERIRDSVVIDAGAYIGDTAHLFLKAYQPRKVVALEPHPKTYQRLVRSVDAWRLRESIIPLHCAVGEEDGEMSLWGEGLGASFIKKVSSTPPNSISVPVKSIDAILGDTPLGRVSLIKLDVEGNEFAAVRGALDTIKRHRPILLVSIYHTAKDFFEVKPLLEELGLGYRFMIRKTTDDLIKEFVLIAY
jgi:FkbM family methyltransferase